MIQITGTDDWRTAHPGAAIGLLEISGVNNRQPDQALNRRKHDTETHLRSVYSGYSRKDFLALPVMAAYQHYYRRFDKTYHVLQQVESIVLKNKSLPEVSPLVDANFAAEVETMVLTAGHDASMLDEPVLIDVSRGNDQMTQLNGTTRTIRPGDMVMRDRNGICCSILYGQDNRSPISPETEHILYVAYVPPEVPVEAVNAQLRLIDAYVGLFSPKVVIEQCRLLFA